MGKGFGSVYKNIQPKCTDPYYNTTFSLLPHSLLSSQGDSTKYCGVAVISHKQASPVSHLTTTKQVDTESNNDYNTHYFSTPRNHNHSTPKIPKTTTTNIPVQPNGYSCICQMSSSTSTTSLKLPPY